MSDRVRSLSLRIQNLRRRSDDRISGAEWNRLLSMVGELARFMPASTAHSATEDVIRIANIGTEGIDALSPALIVDSFYSDPRQVLNERLLSGQAVTDPPADWKGWAVACDAIPAGAEGLAWISGIVPAWLARPAGETSEYATADPDVLPGDKGALVSAPSGAARIVWEADYAGTDTHLSLVRIGGEGGSEGACFLARLTGVYSAGNGWPIRRYLTDDQTEAAGTYEDIYATCIQGHTANLPYSAAKPAAPHASFVAVFKRGALWWFACAPETPSNGYIVSNSSGAVWNVVRYTDSTRVSASGSVHEHITATHCQGATSGLPTRAEDTDTRGPADIVLFQVGGMWFFAYPSWGA